MTKKIIIFISIILLVLNCFSDSKTKSNLLNFFDKLNGSWNPTDFDYKAEKIELPWGEYKQTPNITIIFHNDIISVPGYGLAVILISEKIKDKEYLIKFIGENSIYETEIHFLENNEIEFVDTNNSKGAFLFLSSKNYKKIDDGPKIEKKYFKIIVKNLSFRENPSIKEKRIRMLNEGEIVRFLQEGDQETIEGVKGKWIKAITEKGEIGWCFDAYLKEVKN